MDGRLNIQLCETKSLTFAPHLVPNSTILMTCTNARASQMSFHVVAKLSTVSGDQERWGTLVSTLHRCSPLKNQTGAMLYTSDPQEPCRWYCYGPIPRLAPSPWD